MLNYLATENEVIGPFQKFRTVVEKWIIEIAKESFFFKHDGNYRTRPGSEIESPGSLRHPVGNCRNKRQYKITVTSILRIVIVLFIAVFFRFRGKKGLRITENTFA